MTGTAQKLYKNWKAICQVADRYLRLCLIHATDPELLARLHWAFPELFLPVKPKYEVFPLSVVRRYWELGELECRRERDSDFFQTVPHYLMRELGLPALLCAHHEAENYDRCDLPMPTQIANEYDHLVDIMDEYIMDEYIMEWVRQNCEVVVETTPRCGFPDLLHTVLIDGHEYYVGHVTELDGNSYKSFYVFPVHLIDTEN
jgi:hypothetical protein